MTLLDGPDRIELYYFGAGHTTAIWSWCFPRSGSPISATSFRRSRRRSSTPRTAAAAWRFPTRSRGRQPRSRTSPQVVTGHEQGLAAERDPRAASVDISTPRTMRWTDVQEYAEFKRDFLDAVRKARSAGRTATEAAATLSLPDRYRDYDMRNAVAAVEAIYKEARPMSRFRFADLGPGLLLAAAGIGVGDMVSSIIAGAEYGLVLVWALVAGVVIKHTITEGAARWQLRDRSDARRRVARQPARRGPGRLLHLFRRVELHGGQRAGIGQRARAGGRLPVSLGADVGHAARDCRVRDGLLRPLRAVPGGRQVVHRLQGPRRDRDGVAHHRAVGAPTGRPSAGGPTSKWATSCRSSAVSAAPSRSCRTATGCVRKAGPVRGASPPRASICWCRSGSHSSSRWR